MNQKIYILIGFVLYSVAPAYSESLLQAVQFPKVFDDVSFSDKYEILSEGYSPYDSVYDSVGNCISGCAYSGLNIEQEKQNIEEATQYFGKLIEQAQSGTTTSITTQNQPSNSYIGTPAPTISGDSIPMRSPVATDILITGDFGWRDTDIQGKHYTYLHNGIDIGVNTGTAVYATADGVIKTAATGHNGGNGTYILIQHANGLFSEYKHLSKLATQKGDSVSAGQLIGYSGNTGLSQGPHLHYDVYLNKNGTPAYIDILCPCASSIKTKNYNSSLNTINTGYSCKSSALHKKYKFSGNNKKVKWRIASGHCMTNENDKLPDEM